MDNKAKEESISGEVEEIIDSINLLSQAETETTVTAEGNKNADFIYHEEINKSEPLPSYYQKRENIKSHRLNQKTGIKRKKITKTVIDKDEIAAKMLMRRKEYSKQSTWQAEVKRQLFSM